MSARVRSVTSDSACSRSISPVCRIGVDEHGPRAACSTTLAHDTKVMLGRSTSSPSPISSSRSAIVSAAVHDERQRTWRTWR